VVGRAPLRAGPLLGLDGGGARGSLLLQRDARARVGRRVQEGQDSEEGENRAGDRTGGDAGVPTAAEASCTPGYITS
jgi:hypothetical protein